MQDGKFRQRKQAAASGDKQAANWSGKQHKEATAPASGSAPAPEPAPAQRSRNRRVQPASGEKQAASRSGEQHKQAAAAGEKQTAAAGEKQPAPQSSIQVPCTDLAPLVSALPDSSQTEGQLDGGGTTGSADCGALRLTNTDPIALYTDTLVPNDTRANTKVREDLYELARPLLEKHLKVRRSDFFTQPKGRAKSARLAIQLDNPNRKPMDVKITELMRRLMQLYAWLYGAELPWPGAQGVIMLMLQPREMACTRHNHKMNNGTRAFIFRLEADGGHDDLILDPKSAHAFVTERSSLDHFDSRCQDSQRTKPSLPAWATNAMLEGLSLPPEVVPEEQSIDDVDNNPSEPLPDAGADVSRERSKLGPRQRLKA